MPKKNKKNFHDKKKSKSDDKKKDKKSKSEKKDKKRRSHHKSPPVAKIAKTDRQRIGTPPTSFGHVQGCDAEAKRATMYKHQADFATMTTLPTGQKWTEGISGKMSMASILFNPYKPVPITDTGVKVGGHRGESLRNKEQVVIYVPKVKSNDNAHKDASQKLKQAMEEFAGIEEVFSGVPHATRNFIFEIHHNTDDCMQAVNKDYKAVATKDDDSSSVSSSSSDGDSSSSSSDSDISSSDSDISSDSN